MDSAGPSDKSNKKAERSEKGKALPVNTDNTTKKTQNADFNFLLYIDACEKRSHQENHSARMLKLRKEQNYLKETEWQYEPIEKYIGQS